MAEEIQKTDDFDALAHIKARNEADAARLAGKTVEPPPLPKEAPKATEPTTEEPAKTNRRERRTQFRLREEIGVLKGKLEAYEKMGVSPAVREVSKESPAEEDPEPSRDKFGSDAEFNRALGRWDARQELRKDKEASHTTAELQAERDHLLELSKKAAEDSKAIDKWDELAKKAEALKIDPERDANLMAMIAHSKDKAFFLAYVAENQDEWKALTDLSTDFPEQLKYFGYLERVARKLYTPKQATEVAQASGDSKEKPKERAMHPAEAAQPAGRNASERDALKPRPTSEVSAKGGSAPPETPAVGSKEWMAMRNVQQFGHRS